MGENNYSKEYNIASLCHWVFNLFSDGKITLERWPLKQGGITV